MNIADTILQHYPELNDAQREIISHDEGPLLVIAGPGSGKTYSIILRALNLLMLGKAKPSEMILCTFTEKATFEMRDRISLAARTAGYSGDLSELTVSTIHGLCNRILTQHRHRTDLGHDFETLDELTQALFLFDHFDEIFGPPINDLYFNRWKTRWTAIDGVRGYFDKITEELVDLEALNKAPDAFFHQLAQSYEEYRRLLIENNRVDFANLQRMVLDLLENPEIEETVTKRIRYLLVDEYQDTNYIQERLLLKLSSRSGNLCVVGDEDQSLYRFRGGTVRNILEFTQHVPDCRVIKLTTNYRSHRDIVNRYDRWMASADWSNPKGVPFRFDKTIKPDPNSTFPVYPAVFAIWGKNERDEAKRFADLVVFLKSKEIIEDYSQIALLLHSVRQEHSEHYTEALQEQGIPAFCPRARTYFDNDEIREMVACYALLFGWHGDGRGQTAGAVAELADYVDLAIVHLARLYGSPHPLSESLREWAVEIESLRERESLDVRVADYFYRLLAIDPFRTEIKEENAARRLAIFSQLLNVFQTYYHYTVVTHANREFLRFHFFNSFLRLLYEGGINEYEDPDQPFPKGYVQVMTIHQAKGLEFPVVVVGSLSKQLASQKRVDRDLAPFYKRPPFEPENRVTQFDRMRLHYVAFSRPQKILVLTAHEPPKDYFGPIWQGLPQWPYVEKDLLAAQRFTLHERMPVKKIYSFTGDLRIYETCPRQYQFFREYDYTPSHSAVIFFGLLVHQTIEEIHRHVMDGRIDTLNEPTIRNLFDRAFRFLCLSDVRPIDDVAREAAFTQVMNYFRQNGEEMQRVIETEVDVSMEMEGYILVGKVDLLLAGDGKLELLDFKTSPRPKENPGLIVAYERQLCTYAYILEKRHRKRVDRLLLYWTSEARKEDALMSLPYEAQSVDTAGRHFDEVVGCIKAKEWAIKAPPESGICKECDLRMLCQAEGIVPER